MARDGTNDAYSATATNGKFGSLLYTGTHDGIHLSVADHRLMADLIASRIKLR